MKTQLSIQERLKDLRVGNGTDFRAAVAAGKNSGFHAWFL